MRDELIEKVLETRVIAIVRGLDSKYIVPLAQAYYDGGIRLMEITFNQKDPSSFDRTGDCISALKTAMGNKMYIGAGTVTTPKLCRLAFECGAQFIVSPDTNEKVISATRELGMVSMPGAMTPSEITTAHSAGADFVKIFPAGALGAGYIKALMGPLGHIKYLAVGGVSEKNIGDFVKAGAVGAGVGGNLVNKTWIENGEFDKIAALAKEFIVNSIS